MRTTQNKDGTWTVWMDRDEYHDLLRTVDDAQHAIALRLMGDCGLRVAETLDVEPRDVSRRSDGRHFKLEVMAGKDTTGEFDGGKHRETWLPRDLEMDINRYVQREGIADDEPILGVETTRAVMNWVEGARERAAELTGDDDYLRVSSHDLRRCWAQYLLVERGISPRIVMALGGWSKYDAIEPYLMAPTESNITESMADVEL